MAALSSAVCGLTADVFAQTICTNDYWSPNVGSANSRLRTCAEVAGPVLQTC